MLPAMKDTEGHGGSTHLGFPLNAPNCLCHFEVQQGATYLLDRPRKCVGCAARFPSHGLDVAHRWLSSPDHTKTPLGVSP